MSNVQSDGKAYREHKITLISETIKSTSCNRNRRTTDLDGSEYSTRGVELDAKDNGEADEEDSNDDDDNRGDNKDDNNGGPSIFPLRRGELDGLDSSTKSSTFI